MRLTECSPNEVTILAAISALVAQLPRDPAIYTSAFGEMRKQYFRTAGRSRGDKPRGFVQGHDVRVTDRWR